MSYAIFLIFLEGAYCKISHFHTFTLEAISSSLQSNLLPKPGLATMSDHSFLQSFDTNRTVWVKQTPQGEAHATFAYLSACLANKHRIRFEIPSKLLCAFSPLLMFFRCFDKNTSRFLSEERCGFPNNSVILHLIIHLKDTYV